MTSGKNFFVFLLGIHLDGVLNDHDGAVDVTSFPFKLLQLPPQCGSFFQLLGTLCNPMVNISRSPLLLTLNFRKFFQCSIRNEEKPSSYWQLKTFKLNANHVPNTLPAIGTPNITKYVHHVQNAK